VRHAPDYDRSNRDAAERILSDPARHGRGMVQWASLWQERHGTHQQPETASNGTPARGGQMALGFAHRESGGG
jgi:hypothetical protein